MFLWEHVFKLVLMNNSQGEKKIIMLTRKPAVQMKLRTVHIMYFAQFGKTTVRISCATTKFQVIKITIFLVQHLIFVQLYVMYFLFSMFSPVLRQLCSKL